MPSSIPKPQILNWVFFFSFSLCFCLSLSDPRISQAGLFCGTSRPPSGINNIPIFVKAMEALAELVTKQPWGAHVVDSSPPIYVLSQCFHDLSHTDCLLCYAESRTKLPRCLPAISARIFLDGCFLRYDNYSFFNESIDQSDTVNCSSVLVEEYMKLEFAKKVDQVIKNVTETAVMKGGFGVAQLKGGVVEVYGLAQCWKTVSEEGCRDCLEKAGNEVRGCVPAREGRGLNAGCYLRYSTENFFNDGAKTKGDKGFPGTGVIVAIVLSVVAFSMLALFGACVGYARLSKMKEERNNLGRLAIAVNKSDLNFKYETLEKATDFFSTSRKIGQGGAASVFKGILPDGRTVAVKRLFYNTRQWVDEFFNEVNLINGIEHPNLVKLLGCSIEGPESLLVYEYVHNKSLDQFLFGKSKTQILSWQQRFEIIVGTAKGLAFLHGGSQIRIIHRDIKSSNILLDENLTAKISDFGLARCFAADKSHLSTGIAGTLGYMAPEYLVRGQLTEKADVYSFGVLVLEIICGRKTTVFTKESGSILQTVWKHYNSNQLPESVDPCLRDDFPEKDASNVLKIGLLCTQASVPLRPSMFEVVQMLTNQDCEIPLPKQPPFLNASVLNPNTTKSFSTNSSSSNVPMTVEVSYTSTKSSTMSSTMPSSTSASNESPTIRISEPRYRQLKFSVESETSSL